MTVLAGARVVTPAGVLRPGWVETQDGVIVDVGAGSPPLGADVDLGGAWLLPGFVDLHVHGGGGYDVARSASDMASSVEFHRAHGTTSTLVSLVTAGVDELEQQLSWVAALARRADYVRGAHLEGPFLAAGRCGAQHPGRFLPPDEAIFARLNRAADGYLRVITVAPELSGSLELIRAARHAGVLAAIGHTDATYQQTMSAIAAGAGLATHLLNTMRPLHHREPGAAGAVLDAGVPFEVINDGHHLHPAIVRLLAGLRPAGMVLVTDAISAAGVPDGPTVLGGQDVDVTDGVARLRRDGAMAGSTLTMDEAVRRSVVEVGLDVSVVAAAAATTPATLLRIDDRLGAIKPGLAADLVVLDDDFRLVRVLQRNSATPS